MGLCVLCARRLGLSVHVSFCIRTKTDIRALLCTGTYLSAEG